MIAFQGAGLTQDRLACETSKRWQTMNWIASTVCLLALGAGTLFYAWRGHISGELAMARFFRMYRPNRQDHPFAFYFYLGLLIVVGTVEIVWGILIFFGLLSPLPWR
jgi:hypothetical protein